MRETTSTGDGRRATTLQSAVCRSDPVRCGSGSLPPADTDDDVPVHHCHTAAAAAAAVTTAEYWCSSQPNDCSSVEPAFLIHFNLF